MREQERSSAVNRCLQIARSNTAFNQTRIKSGLNLAKVSMPALVKAIVSGKGLYSSSELFYE